MANTPNQTRKIQVQPRSKHVTFPPLMIHVTGLAQEHKVDESLAYGSVDWVSEEWVIERKLTKDQRSTTLSKPWVPETTSH